MREFKRERGFLTFAQNGKVDYVRLAFALALSLKASQTQYGHLAIVVTPGTSVSEEYAWAFDEIIEVPWLDEASASDWKLENEWKAYHITPYRETIKLDADMLFPTDIASWWDHLSLQDFCAATSAMTYRGQVITSDHYRKTFTSNSLPNVYSAFTYFRYSDTAEQVFAMMETIFHNWQHFFFTYLDDTRPAYVSTDVVMALAIKLLDLEDKCLPLGNYPCMTHMKTQLQNWPHGAASENWLQHIDVSLTSNLMINIGRFRQIYPLHYHNKDFLSDEIVETYRKALETK